MVEVFSYFLNYLSMNGLPDGRHFKGLIDGIIDICILDRSSLRQDSFMTLVVFIIKIPDYNFQTKKVSSISVIIISSKRIINCDTSITNDGDKVHDSDTGEGDKVRNLLDLMADSPLLIFNISYIMTGVTKSIIKTITDTAQLDLNIGRRSVIYNKAGNNKTLFNEV